MSTDCATRMRTRHERAAKKEWRGKLDRPRPRCISKSISRHGGIYSKPNTYEMPPITTGSLRTLLRRDSSSTEGRDDSETTDPTPESTGPTEARKNAADVELLERLGYNLCELINNRDWATLSGSNSQATSPTSSSRSSSIASPRDSTTSPTDSTRSTDSFTDHLAPTFAISLSNRDSLINLQDFVRLQQIFCQRAPHYHIAVQDISTEIDMRHGWANMLAFVAITGHPAGVSRQSIVMFRWKRWERQWWCTKLTTLRGGGSNEDVDCGFAIC